MCRKEWFQVCFKIISLFLLCGWAIYGGDLQNTRYKNLSFNCQNLKIIWKFKPEKHIFRYSPFTNIWSTPVAGTINGKTFIYIGFYDYNLYCIDLKTGKEIWRFTSGNKIISSPVFFKINEKYLVSFASRDRRIYCLDAETGQRLWTYEVYPWRYTVQEAIPSSGIFIPELGNLYFTIYICDKKPFKTVEEAVVIALTWKGELVWKKKIKNAGILSSPCYARLNNKHFLFISSSNGNLYAVSAENGKILWTVTLGDKTYATPSVLKLEDKIIIYIGDKFGYLYALDEKGKIIWKFKTGHFIDTSAAILNGKKPKVYITSFDRKLYCLDALVGRKIFEFETHNYLYSSPLIVKIRDKRCVIFSSLDNTIFILDAENGSLIEKIKLGKRIFPYETYGETIWPSPIVVQSSAKTCLIYPSTEGILFCLGCNS